MANKAKTRKNKKRFSKKIIIVLGLILIITGIIIVKHVHNKAPVPVPEAADGTGPRACISNPKDICILAPAVDFYPSPAESMSNPGFLQKEGQVAKQIGGVITEYEGSSVKLKTESGRRFTINFPINVISWWAQTRSSYYGGYKVGVGDTLTVTYFELPKDKSTTIEPSQISTSNFAIAQTGSKSTDGIIRKYQPPK